MGDSTGIEWTDSTWNPVRGCSRVSEGCRNCYAERTAARFSGPGQPYEGLAIQRSGKGSKWTGEVRLVPERLADPLRWRKARRIFVNSMSDLFHERLSNEAIAAVFGVMAASPQHTFQVLTKRARRMREWFEWLDAQVESEAVEWSGNDCSTSIHDARNELRFQALDDAGTAALAGHYDVCHLALTSNDALTWPLGNVWLGVSVENDEVAYERIPQLLATPAAVRFLSCEPLLGPVSLGAAAIGHCSACGSRIGCGCGLAHWQPRGLDWVIAGCESGPGARPCDVAWLRSLRDQCAAAGVAFFLKQAVESSARTAIAHLASWPKSRMHHNLIEFGPGSTRKHGGVIGAPYLDGAQHLAFPTGERDA